MTLRKILATLLALSMTLSLAACGGNSTQTDTTAPSEQTEESSSVSDESASDETTAENTETETPADETEASEPAEKVDINLAALSGPTALGMLDLLEKNENGEAAKKPEICNCTEKCEAGKVNTSCPVCVTSMTGCTGKEPTPTPTEQPEEPKEKGGNPGVVLALVLFALLGGGAAFYYFKFLKPKQNVKGDTDLEDFEFEDYDEDEPEADTGETSEDEETEEETL